MKVLNKRIDVIPEGAVYVGRPTKWGNPFRLHSYKNKERPEDVWLTEKEERKVVVDLYRAHLTATGLIKDIHELKGKDLVCWCSPEPCHADVLLEIANDPV